MKSKSLRSFILAGLVVWLPILVTLVILRFLIDLLDSTIALLPQAYQPETLIGMRIPGLGVILSLMVLMVTGIIATNFFGQRLVSWGEAVLARIPLVRTVHTAAKQIIQAIFASNSQAFRKVMLVEYPRKGLWSLAFLTGSTTAELTKHCQQDMLSLFIPTTPNPTSGFLVLVPKNEVIELQMSVDEALKYIISLGVMQSSTADFIKQ
ncbi:transmembrane protein [Legionella birminghamensis]|uniref:Transmembrane protein n=1 Tax=Legionella birminghamensis TaxID=28083 RepID=A0A378I8M2_9GAMM|nr:DUF502 domain-containing protein [Legionella birminghamensis]KTC69306.1 transmembrane protein [Legionella birminghamensis]STX31568.1 transmembrane protein [Legionella birminghamensis]